MNSCTGVEAKFKDFINIININKNYSDDASIITSSEINSFLVFTCFYEDPGYKDVPVDQQQQPAPHKD